MLRATALFALALSAACPASAQPRLEDALAHRPVSAGERRRLLEGEVVVRSIEEAGQREIAVGAGCLLRGGEPASAVAPFLADRPILPEDNLREAALIEGEPSPDLFRAIRLEPDLAAEVARYLKAHPGFELNLSEGEIDAFQSVERSARTEENQARVHELLYELLSSRYASYRARGLEGIADYVRTRGSRASPADELRRSTVTADFRPFSLAFERAWLEYPQQQPPGARDTYFWARVEVDERPAVALVHRLSVRTEHGWVVGQRSFYVSHFFDTGESLVAVKRVAEGALVLFQNRIWVDDLSGMGWRVKKALGRRFLMSHVEQTFERLAVCSR